MDDPDYAHGIDPADAQSSSSPSLDVTDYDAASESCSGPINKWTPNCGNRVLPDQGTNLVGSDDVWLDENGRIVSYVAWGTDAVQDANNEIGDRPPLVSWGLWDIAYEANLGTGPDVTSGQSIALALENSTSAVDSACWEPNASGDAAARCAGANLTINRDPGADDNRPQLEPRPTQLPIPISLGPLGMLAMSPIDPTTFRSTGRHRPVCVVHERTRRLTKNDEASRRPSTSASRNCRRTCTHTGTNALVVSRRPTPAARTARSVRCSTEPTPGGEGRTVRQTHRRGTRPRLSWRVHSPRPSAATSRSTAATTRTCWWYGSTTSSRPTCGVAGTSTSGTSNRCSSTKGSPIRSSSSTSARTNSVSVPGPDRRACQALEVLVRRSRGTQALGRVPASRCMLEETRPSSRRGSPFPLIASVPQPRHHRRTVRTLEEIAADRFPPNPNSTASSSDQAPEPGSHTRKRRDRRQGAIRE